MQQVAGNLQKMRSEMNHPVDYFLVLGDQEIALNRLIGQEVELLHNGVINCVVCQARTKKTYGQGFCYTCFTTAPEASESVLRPELSQAEFGLSRDMAWAREHDLIEHIVYLALTNELKVGVTRHHQVPVRWIDQGAAQAVPLARTPNRRIAGIIEVFLKKFLTDRTNWQAMLKNETNQHVDLLAEHTRVGNLLPAELRNYLVSEPEIVQITYPVEKYPDKVESLSFDSTPVIKGCLTGIRGQYLYLDGQKVINIRKHSGYWVEFRYTSD